MKNTLTKPINLGISRSFKKSPLTTHLLLAVSLLALGTAQAEDLVVNDASHRVDVDTTYDNVTITRHWVPQGNAEGFDEKLLYIGNPDIHLTINGDFIADATADVGDSPTVGNITTLTTHRQSVVKILGNVSSITRVNGSNVTTGGANNFYVNFGSTLDVGGENTTTKIWSIGAKPDALTAKDKSTFTIHSTQNQIVGSVDFINELDRSQVDFMEIAKILNGGRELTDGDTPVDPAIHDWIIQSSYIGAIFGGDPNALFVRDLGQFISDYTNKEAVNHTKALEAARRILALVKPPYDTSSGKDSLMKMTLAGENSYWYGDEQNGANVYISVSGVTGSDFSATYPQVGNLLANGLFTDILEGKNFNPEAGGTLDVTLKDGAQWTYFGIADSLSSTVPFSINTTFLGFVPIHADIGTLTIKTRSIPKRISALTLEDGGIVNLYDENILAKWREIGLDQAFPEVMNVKHDYVRIGDLKGNGGIFRLDLTDDKANSDMIFVEKASGGPGTFKIEPYDPNKLTGITETNTLRFATVSAAAKDNITFVDSINIKGEQLKDYKLYIRKKPYDVNDPENETYEKKVYDDEAAFAEVASTDTSATARSARTYYTFNSAVDFEGGENWEIYRFEKTDNENALNIHQSLESGWYYARTLDRLHQRLGEIRYADQGNKGLWARARYERLDQHSLNLDRTMVQIGTDFRNTDRNRIGIAFDYNWGDQDYDHMKGSSDLKGYSVLFYDTWLKENGAWIDLTASLGRQKIKSTTPWSDGTEFTSNYHQNVYKLGIEAGHKFDHQTDAATYFIEPQLQLQYTRVGSTSFTTSNDVNVSIDSAKSLIGRAGFRLGREWLNDAGRMNNVYLVADVLREFSNGQKGVATLGIDNTYHAWGGKSTWYDLGISTQMSLSERTALHLDLLKNFGAGYHNAWLANVNFRYTF